MQIFFQDKNNSIESWTVGSCSCCTQRSYIIKNGSDSDILNSPEEKRKNIPHAKKSTVKKNKNNKRTEDNLQPPPPQPLPPSQPIPPPLPPP